MAWHVSDMSVYNGNMCGSIGDGCYKKTFEKSIDIFLKTYIIIPNKGLK